MKSKLTKFYIGEVGVDSGQLMLCDPCYIESEWVKESKSKVKAPGHDYLRPTASGEFSYNGACEVTLSKESAGQLYYKMGHAGVGVAFSSGYGDGCYKVYGYKNEDGRIVKVTVEME